MTCRITMMNYARECVKTSGDCLRYRKPLRLIRIFPPDHPPLPRDSQLVEIETHIRQAIRDAVNRSSRKPFVWGGLMGYEQLEAIARGLAQVQGSQPESNYLDELQIQVKRALVKNRTTAEDLKKAYQILLQVAKSLRYPPSSYKLSSDQKVNSQQVAQEITQLIHETKPSGRVQKAQISLFDALSRRWNLYNQELLYCYDIPGLPQDNLKMERLFG